MNIKKERKKIKISSLKIVISLSITNDSVYGFLNVLVPKQRERQRENNKKKDTAIEKHKKHKFTVLLTEGVC